MRPRRVIFLTVTLLALHEGLARALDALDAGDQLLASGGARLGLLALLGAFLCARLALFFVAPGLAIVAVAVALFSARRRGS
jgi:hypothetical protein